MWQTFKSWVSKKLFDALARDLGKVVKKISFEKVIRISAILFIIAGLSLLVLGNVLVANNTWVKFYRMIQVSDDFDVSLSSVNSETDSEAKTVQNNDRNDDNQGEVNVPNESDEFQIIEQEHIFFNWSI